MRFSVRDRDERAHRTCAADTAPLALMRAGALVPRTVRSIDRLTLALVRVLAMTRDGAAAAVLALLALERAQQADCRNVERYCLLANVQDFTMSNGRRSVAFERGILTVIEPTGRVYPRCEDCDDAEPPIRLDAAMGASLCFRCYERRKRTIAHELRRQAKLAAQKSTGRPASHT